MQPRGSRPLLRFTSPAEVVAAVPHLCGFVPTESLVAMSLRGTRRRVGLTMRIDLSDGADVELAELVAARLAQDGADATVIVVYTEVDRGDHADQASGPAGADLVQVLRTTLDQSGIEVVDALLVRSGRWWSYLCDEPECCPAHGTLIGSEPAVELLVAELAHDGRAVLQDRNALVASLAPPQCLAAEAARQQLAAACARWAAAVGERGREAVAADCVDAVRDALASAGLVPEPHWAWLVAGLQDVVVRDNVALLALDAADVLLGLLLELARRTVAPYDVPVCTLVALVAWVRGDGALANVALDRALTSDPAASMALLARTGLDAQVPPAAVRSWLRETRRHLSPAAVDHR